MKEPLCAYCTERVRFVKKVPSLSLRDPERVVAISQNCFEILTNFGKFETACTRLPRRFAPRNDTGEAFRLFAPIFVKTEKGGRLFCLCEEFRWIDGSVILVNGKVQV